MTGATIEVSLDLGDLRTRLARLRALGWDATPLMRDIGEGVRATTQARFDSGTDPEGAPWKPWSPAYAAVTKSSGILRDAGMRGGLMGSITYEAGARSVRVGSNKVYAAAQQFGATIRPVRAPALRFMLGEKVVFAKKVTLPARPYLGWGPAERQVVEDAAGRAFGAALDP